MAKPKITIRYEYLKRDDQLHDEEFDVPEGWAAMTDTERHDWCAETAADGLSDYISTSYEWEGMEP